jgi:flagellar basal body-associated protein FliL
MSDEAEEKPEGGEEGAEKPAKKKGGGGGSLVPMLLGVLNLGVSGFLLFKTMTHKPPEAPPPPPGAAIAEAPGPVVALDPFVLNLSDEPQSRYLKATFEIELDNEKAKADFEKGKRAVRDELLRYLSGLSAAQTLGEANKEKIQEQILARVEKQLGPGRARRVFISDFVVQ